MRDAQRGFQHAQQGAPGAGLLRVAGCAGEHRLDQLQIPVAEVVPDEVVDRLRGKIEAIAVELLRDFCLETLQARHDPAIRLRQLDRVVGGRHVVVADLHEREPRGVPELVAEVAIALDTAQVETDIAPGRGKCGEGEAQCVGAVGGDTVGEGLARGLLDCLRLLRLHHVGGALGDQRFQVDAVDQVDRVQHIALGLGHLGAVRVAHEAMDIDLAKRHVVHEFQAHHDHPGDPEEDDVEAGDQHRRRVEGLERARVLGPAERGEGPQARGVPGVEYVLVLRQRDVVGEVVARPGVGLVLADVDVARVVVPGRNPVAPPELARDAPVLDVAHPFEIGLVPVGRHELDTPVLDRLDRRFGKRLGVHEPLVGEHRLDHVARAVAVGLHDRLVFDGDHQAVGVDRRDDLPAGLESLQAAIRVRHQVYRVHVGGARRGAGGHDLGRAHGGALVGFAVIAQVRGAVHEAIHGNVVAPGDFVVVEVVRAGDLHRARAEFRVRVFVGDDRDQPALCLGADRDLAALAHDRRIARVVRMHGDRAVAEHGFRTRGGDRDVIAGFAKGLVAVVVGLDVFVGLAVFQRILEVPHVAGDFGVFDLEIGDRRVEYRIPVDQPLAAIDQALVVEGHEGIAHGFRQAVVHGETLARPVHRGAHASHLARDVPTGFGLPVPDAIGEGITAE